MNQPNDVFVLPAIHTIKVFLRIIDYHSEQKVAFYLPEYEITMSFKLIDTESEYNEFDVNIWKWTAALELIKRLDIIGDSRVREMSRNAAGVKVDAEEAHLIGRTIIETVLPSLGPGRRIFADGTVTDKPDDGTFYGDPSEQWKNYSVSTEWLRDFADFCLRSNGFRIF